MTHLCRWFAVLAGTGLYGCGHSEPFGTPTFGSDQPFDPTPPVQLTLNRGPDRSAAWLPDGSGILYSTQSEARQDHDVCLAELPATGGRQRSLQCDLSPSAWQLTEALESAAPADDGRLAFFASTSFIGATFPDSQRLAIGQRQNPAERTSLLAIPYTIPGHPTHGGISQLRWLGPSRLLFLGEAVNIITPCNGCQKDTLRSGLDAVVLDLPAGVPQAVPGSQYASGVSPGGNPDEIYYTLAGDTRVYRQQLSSGAISQVYDFGAAGIARDVHVLGSRMAATVGGKVHFVADPSLGPTQWDSGGTVHVVDLTDGSDAILQGPAEPMLFRRPQLSPTGTAVVAEGYPMVILAGPIEGQLDTLVLKVGDLFLFGSP